MERFICPICGNDDETYFFKRGEVIYCRRCISFQGELASPEAFNVEEDDVSLTYDLSIEQKDISSRFLNSFKAHKNTLIHAVCGAGKTEIVYETIAYALNEHMHVGFATPRKDVVIELLPRFKEAFKKARIIALYGGHTSELYGDIILLTTHQLFRYQKYFDLLIIDEVDAFPFKGNETLEHIALNSVRGNYCYMSATPDENLIASFQNEHSTFLELFVRFHKKAIPVPKLIWSVGIIKYIILIYKLKIYQKNHLPCLVFCPTIELSKKLYSLLKLFIPNGTSVSSIDEERMQKVQDFKDGKYTYLCTTSILERGVTIKDLQVIVFDAHHPLYNRYALVQIAGRVGRKMGHEGGEVIFLGHRIDQEMVKAKKDIESANEHL